MHVLYNVCLKKGSDQWDQLIVTLYTLAIYPSVHKQLFRSFRTLFEAHIVHKRKPKRSWNYLVKQMMLFLYKHPQNSELTIFAIRFRVQFSFSFVIFQYGGAQYEWSSSLNRFPPKFSSFFKKYTIMQRRVFDQEKENRVKKSKLKLTAKEKPKIIKTMKE